MVKRLQLRVTPEIKKRLEHNAINADLTPSELIEDLVRRHTAEVELRPAATPANRSPAANSSQK